MSINPGPPVGVCNNADEVGEERVESFGGAGGMSRSLSILSSCVKSRQAT